jgi:hypothetical protein
MRLIQGQLRENHRKGGMMGAIMGRLFTAQNPGSFGGVTLQLQPSGAPTRGIGGLGQAQSLLQFRGKGDDPQMITAAVTAVGPGGPITGIIFWGSGNGQNHRCEFDVGSFGNANDPSPIGGTLVSVNATHLELQVRNDGNFIPGFPGDGSFAIGAPTPVPTVIGSLGIGTKISGTRAFKTTYLVNANAGGPGLPAGGTSFLTPLPPFTTSFVIQRSDAQNSMSFVLMNAFGLVMDGPYNVAANARCPEIPMSGWTKFIQITNTGGTAINNLSIISFLAI